MLYKLMLVKSFLNSTVLFVTPCFCELKIALPEFFSFLWKSWLFWLLIKNYLRMKFCKQTLSQMYAKRIKSDFNTEKIVCKIAIHHNRYDRERESKGALLYLFQTLYFCSIKFWYISTLYTCYLIVPST